MCTMSVILPNDNAADERFYDFIAGRGNWRRVNTPQPLRRRWFQTKLGFLA